MDVFTKKVQNSGKKALQNILIKTGTIETGL